MSDTNKLLLLILISAVISRYMLCMADEIKKKQPSLLIVTLIRNKAHTLPYFFSYLENQDYPKNRISLW